MQPPAPPGVVDTDRLLRFSPPPAAVPGPFLCLAPPPVEVPTSQGVLPGWLGFSSNPTPSSPLSPSGPTPTDAELGKPALISPSDAPDISALPAATRRTVKPRRVVPAPLEKPTEVQIGQSHVEEPYYEGEGGSDPWKFSYRNSRTGGAVTETLFIEERGQFFSVATSAEDPTWRHRGVITMQLADVKAVHVHSRYGDPSLPPWAGPCPGCARRRQASPWARRGRRFKEILRAILVGLRQAFPFLEALVNPMCMATAGALLMTNSLWRVFPRDGMHFDMDEHASEQQLGLSLILATANFFFALFPLWWVGALRMCCCKHDSLLRGLVRRLPSESANRWCRLQRLLHVCALVFFMGWCLLVIILVPWIRYDLNDVCVPYHEYAREYPFKWALAFPGLGIPERVAEAHGLHPTLLPAFSQAALNADPVGVRQVVAGQCASVVMEFETHFAWPRQFLPAVEGGRIGARYDSDVTYGSIGLTRHLHRTTRLQCDEYVAAVEWLDFATHDLPGYSLHGRELRFHARSVSGEEVRREIHSFNPYGGPSPFVNETDVECDEFAEEYMGGCGRLMRFDAPPGHAVVGFRWSNGRLTGIESLPLSLEAAGYIAFGAGCFDESASFSLGHPDPHLDGSDETLEECEYLCTASRACSAFEWSPSANFHKCSLKLEADGISIARTTVPEVARSDSTCYAKKRATCSASVCGRGRMPKHEDELPDVCEGTSCSTEECCDNGGTCAATFTSDCSPGLLQKLFPPKRCGDRNCTEAECCEAAPTCTQSACDLWHTVKNYPPLYCEGRTCTNNECCARADSCDEKHCLSSNGTLKSQQRTYCIALSCTPEECCDFPNRRRLDDVGGEETSHENSTTGHIMFGVVASENDDTGHARQPDQASGCTNGCHGEGASYNGLLIIDLKTIQAMKSVHFADFVNATILDSDTEKKLGVFDLSAGSIDSKRISNLQDGSGGHLIEHHVVHDSGGGLLFRTQQNDFGGDGQVGEETEGVLGEDADGLRRLMDHWRRLEGWGDGASAGPGGVVSSGPGGSVSSGPDGSGSSGPGGAGAGSTDSGVSGAVNSDSAGSTGSSASTGEIGSDIGMGDFMQASRQRQGNTDECYLVSGEEVCGVGACHCSPMAEMLCMKPPDLVPVNDSFDLDGCIMVKRPMCSSDNELDSGALAPAHFLAWTSAFFCLILFLNQIVLTAAHLEYRWARRGPRIGLSQETPEKAPENRLHFQHFTVVFWIDPDEWCFPRFRRTRAMLWLDRLLPAAWRCSVDFRLRESADVDARLVMDLLLTRRPDSKGTDQARADLKDLCNIASDLRVMAPSRVQERPCSVAFHADALGS